jgi:hypothetical protein
VIIIYNYGHVRIGSHAFVSMLFSAGYVWAYNTQPYFESIGQTRTDIGKYMSWIPLVAGCIGVVLGGFISDRVVKRIGPHARLLVLIVSQVSQRECIHVVILAINLQAA